MADALSSRSDSLGTSLRRRRVSLGLSQAEAAAGLGVSQPSYSSWERNDGRPDAEHLGAIARFLERSIDDVWRMAWDEPESPDGWSDTPLSFRLRSMDERISELETMMSCVVDLVVGGTSENGADQPMTPGISVSTRSADALRAHETIRSRTATYHQQLVDTPDFRDVCAECPDLDELSGQQISYWKAEYTKRGGKHAAWR